MATIKKICSSARTESSQNLFWLLLAAAIWFTPMSSYGGGVVPILPVAVVEGAGILTNSGQLNLGAVASSNISVTLLSSDPASISLPLNVTILSGQSNVFFDLGVEDNLIVDGNRNVTVIATTDFSTNATSVLVIDNDPDRIAFSTIPIIVDTNTTFTVHLTAVNADGSVQTNFNKSLTMTAIALEGPLSMAGTNSGNFTQGQLTIGIQVTAPGHGVQLGCREYPGQSAAFTVIPPAFYVSSQPVSDIVWLSNSQTLLASVPATGGVYSNCLVAIDPGTGLATNSYPVGFNPGQVEISPAGDYLYIALSNQTLLQRFTTANRTASPPFVLGTNVNPYRFAYDFCVPPGLTNSVVVAARLEDNLGNTSIDGIYRYDTGHLVALPNFTASGGYLVESMDTGNEIALSPPLATGNASDGTIITTAASFPGGGVTYRNGQFYDGFGNVYGSNNLSVMGTYPSVLDQVYYRDVVEVDSFYRRVFYLSGYYNYGQAFYNLKVYDRDLYVPLFEWPMPSATGVPTRLLRCGTNLLAYVTSNGQLWFIRPDATQPPRPAADLALSATVPGASPILGVNYTFSMTLSNLGPGEASVVLVSNTLPANSTLVQTSPTSGTVTALGTVFTWTVGDLAAGSNATLQVTVVFNNGGWQTNTAWALGFEQDPVFTNNVASVPLYVQLPQQAFGVYNFNFPTEDLLYDPARDRLLLTVSNGPAMGQTNGVAVFNPYTGTTDSFTSLGAGPNKMARSYDGQFLYVSLPDLGIVRQLSLPTLAKTYDTALGGDNINGSFYPDYAKSLAAVPNAPGSFVAWRVRHAGSQAQEYGEGIGLWQDGTLESNLTSYGGAWEAVFDTNADLLFGYDAGQLEMCSLNSNGVSFVTTYPALTSAGGDIEYGGGHFFNTGGEMVDYDPFQVDWLFPGAQSTAAIATDPPTSRVFYLVQNGSWQIQTYDVPTRHLLGSLVVSNVSGTPGRMVRWGQDGLAFQTSSNQLFVIRSPMVRTDSFADLAVTVAGPGGILSVSNNANFMVTVTNQGVVAATNIVLTNGISMGAGLSGVSVSAGTFSANTNGQSIVWSIPNLNPASGATLTFAVSTSQTGLVTVISVASTTTFDLSLSNNTAVATALVGQQLSLDTPLIIPLLANDAVWSPTLAKILLSANVGISNWAGSLFSIDPASFAVQIQAALGSDCNRLALSSDGTTLFVGTDFGASTVSIPSLLVSNRFLINPTVPGDYAFDIQVQPGSNQVAVIGSKIKSNNGTWVAAYNNGVQLSGESAFNSTAMSLQFGNAPSPLYAYTGSTFNRYTIDTNGVTTIDATSGLLPTSTPMNLAWGHGLIYSSVGQVIDPVALKGVGVLSGIPSGSLVVYDTNSGWFFYLSPGANQAVLTAFDGASLLSAGSRIIPGVSGSLTRFIRWGTDGFATLTSSGQIVLFRSSLIPTNPPADVSLSLVQSSPPYFQGSNITASIVISNAGPNAATSILWSNALPAGAVVQNVTVSSGSFVTNPAYVAGSLPSLNAGSAATVNVNYIVPTAGITTNQATVTASSVDPIFTNNSVVALFWVQATNGVSNTLSLSLPVNDLERDPIRPLLYASFGTNAGPIANSVVTLDPVNEVIGAPVFVGSNPNKLAASPDGQYLYVALDGASAVAELSLPSLALVGTFALAQGQKVARMAVCPTNSSMVAIRRYPGDLTGLYIAGVKLPNELASQDLFAFSDTTGALFGCDSVHSNVKLYQLDTSAAGLALLAGQPGKQASSTNLVSSGGLLFYNGGLIINPVTTRSLDLLNEGSTAVVAADAGCGRAFYMTSAGGTWSIHAFDITQGIEVGSVTVPSLLSAPLKLMRWGADGLAFYNSSSQIVILRGQLVPTNPSIDLVLSQTISNATATTNATINISLQLTNLGPLTAPGIVVTQLFSLPLTNVTLAPSTGTATYTNGVVSWQAGSLATNLSASLNVAGQATKTGTLTASAFAHHTLNDVFWGNNAAVGAVSILNTNTSNILAISLSAHALAYDSFRDLIYASTPGSNQLTGNLVAIMDPATGNMKSAYAAGSEPDQLSLSADGSFLHVALDGAMGVQRFNLVSNVADLSFSLGSSDIYYALDLITQPGNPATVVSSLQSYNFASGYPSSVFAYDSGVARTNSGGPSRGLTFSADGSTVFGEVSPGSGPAVERMSLGPTGFTTITEGGFTAVPGILKFSNGRLYSAAGQVLDPVSGILIGAFGVSGPEAIDVNGGRAFVLTASGTNWQINAFSLSTLLATGTQSVPGVLGTPSSLTRCGQDRLAFVTTAGQIFIVHSSLVVTNPVPQANLTVFQTATQDFASAGDPMRFVVTVTNRGPGSASNVLLTIASPAPVASTSLQLSQGTSTNAGAGFLCNLGSVASGASVTLTLSAILTNTGYYSNTVNVSAATPDPDLSDNTSTAVLQGLFFQLPNSARIYGPPTTALAYDAIRQHLLASTTLGGVSNTIAWFDPQSGVQLGAMPVGLTANSMQVTDDGQFLYLASHAGGLMQRINLASMTLDTSFALPGAVSVWGMAILPGSPHSIALSYNLNNTSGPTVTAVYDDTVARANELMDHAFTILATSSDATTLYGYVDIGTGFPRVYRISITGSGLSEVDNAPNDTPFVGNSIMKFGGGRLFFGSGDVLDVPSWVSEQAFTLPGGVLGGNIVPLVNLGLAAIETGDANNSSLGHLGIFSIATRQELQQIDVPVSVGGGGLTWCGADRFAFGTSTGIAFVRASSVPAADVSASASFSTNQIVAGGIVNLQITVSNAGPYAVTNVFLTNSLPSGFYLLSATPSNISMMMSGSNLVFSMGAIATNTNASLNLSLTLSNSLVYAITNAMVATDTVSAVATDVADPIPFNNESTASFVINPLVIGGLRFSSWALTGTTNLSLAVDGALGATYVLETSSDLNIWTPVFNFLCQSNNQAIQIPINPDSAAGYFRITPSP